jgi:hypothetical protein
MLFFVRPFRYQVNTVTIMTICFIFLMQLLMGFAIHHRLINHVLVFDFRHQEPAAFRSIPHPYPYPYQHVAGDSLQIVRCANANFV